jgi:hypothetical protein
MFNLLCKLGLHAWQGDPTHRLKGYTHAEHRRPAGDHFHMQQCSRCGARRRWCLSRGRWRSDRNRTAA